MIFLFGFVSSAICGDGECDAGISFDDDHNKIEDKSTCWEDCAYLDYTECELDTLKGGDCIAGERTYEMTNINWTGCGPLNPILDLDISFRGKTIERKGMVPGNWISVMDGLEIYIKEWPCATYTSTKKIILKYPGNELINFITSDKDEFNLKLDKKVEYEFNLPLEISEPYCKYELINEEKDESMEKTSQLNCPHSGYFEITDSYTPGRYLFISEIYDNTGNHKIGESSKEYILHDCETDKDCSDSKFYTKDSCSLEGEIKMCENKFDSLYIYLGLILVFIIIFSLFLFIRKRK